MNLKEIYNQKNKRLNDKYKQGIPQISFEIFPDDNLEHIYNELEILKKYEPALISLTYCALGSNKPFSMDILKHLKNNLGVEVMPHFTCVCNSKQSIEINLQQIGNIGIKNILALRGDIPEDKTKRCDDFKYANELVTYISQKTKLSIAVAGYPEGHIESPNSKFDIDILKKKIDAGANAIYTQLFFDNSKFFTYVELLRKSGIQVPIIPGIMPIIGTKQMQKMSKLAKIKMPPSLKNKLQKFENNPKDIKKIGIDFASTQCQQLVDSDVSGLHFYTLNKSEATSAILDNIL